MSRILVALAITAVVWNPVSGARRRSSFDSATIDRAKHVIISTFDPLLPNLTLESFLQYETGDPHSEWSSRRCTSREIGSREDLLRLTCVEVLSVVSDHQRLVRVVLEVSSEVSVAPTLVSVEVVGADGLARRLRLIELPAAIQEGRKPGQRLGFPPVVAFCGTNLRVLTAEWPQ